MSFMFNPTDYSDPAAVNRLNSTGLDLSRACFSNLKVAEGMLASGAKVIGVDGYATAPYSVLINLLNQAARQMEIPLTVLSTDGLWRDADELSAELISKYLPEDRDKDPVLLYGKLFDGEYEDLMRLSAREEMILRIQEFRNRGNGVLVVCGAGALCAAFSGMFDRRVWLDVLPLRAILNVKEGKYHNIGLPRCLTFKQTARRCYFVDFELALRSRERLLSQDAIDIYVAASKCECMWSIPMEDARRVFQRGLEYPFRCRPVYLEGVWGGYYVKKLRNLPESMKNCAWVFDMIPMEVSIAYEVEGRELEFPFYTLVQSESRRLMGAESVAHFGRYFPIRFNYDDTFHSNGNMSVQCHPTREYIRAENGEFDRQDESYYVVATGQGARTYLGLHDGVDADEFFQEARRSARDATPVDYQQYVNAVESRPGVQVMIPAGTIHASGRNQVVLEIGSLTVGSYTYKMYDYCRLDLDGNPRPLHIYHGDKVLNRERTASWVGENLVQSPHTVRSGPDWEEFKVGEHPLLYFSLRNVRFVSRYTDDTKGRFHVLALVDGERVMVRSLRNPDRSFIQNYLDIVVIPADMGEYEVVNLTEGTTVTIHKTLLKDDFQEYQG